MTDLIDKTELSKGISPATLLNSRYECRRRIGSGGMADVYEGIDHELDRTVAIKVLKQAFSKDAIFSTMFKTEAQAAARLSNSHTVHIFDVGEHSGYRYIVMEYVNGTDLKQHLSLGKPLNPTDIAKIGAQVCSALQEAHRHGIIHRDIKSSNIMVLNSDDTTGSAPSGPTIKLMDFGIAQMERPAAAGNEEPLLGTLRYMSPETLAGSPATPASDLFSLGVVLYECCSGRFPYDGETQQDIEELHQRAQFASPQELSPYVDDDLNKIILTALQADPAKRYTSAEQMGVALTDYLGSSSHPQSHLDYPKAWVIGFTQGPAEIIGAMQEINHPVVLGRSRECDIPLPEETLSRRHIRLSPRGMYLEIEDLGSSNGTLLDGVSVKRKPLCQAGAGIVAGGISFRVGAIRA